MTGTNEPTNQPTKRFLSYLSKQYFAHFDQIIKNRLAYGNYHDYNAIFLLVTQTIFLPSSDNFLQEVYLAVKEVLITLR